LKYYGGKLVTAFSKLLIIAFIIVGSALSGNAADRLPVFVSIPPQKWFVEQIGKGLVDVRVMLPPGADPHTYEPRPRQMAALSRAELYFAVGVEFERARLGKILSINPEIRVVNTDRGIEKIPMATHHEHDTPAAATGAVSGEGRGHGAENGHGHDDDHDRILVQHTKERHEAGNGHGSEGDPGHPDRGGADPHIWLSPKLAIKQARTILDALMATDPAHRSAYRTNYDAFASALTTLDTELTDLFKDTKGLRFMVFHPSWGYFARSYGLMQVPVEVEGKTPKPGQLRELIRYARENRIRVVFVQPQFSAKSARLIAGEIGGEVAFVDPLAEDWAANLREVASKFRAALK